MVKHYTILFSYNRQFVFQAVLNDCIVKIMPSALEYKILYWYVHCWRIWKTMLPLCCLCLHLGNNLLKNWTLFDLVYRLNKGVSPYRIIELNINSFVFFKKATGCWTMSLTMNYKCFLGTAHDKTEIGTNPVYYICSNYLLPAFSKKKYFLNTLVRWTDNSTYKRCNSYFFHVIRIYSVGVLQWHPMSSSRERRGVPCWVQSVVRSVYECLYVSQIDSMKFSFLTKHQVKTIAQCFIHLFQTIIDE